ncbi:SulP family inorganic anion transporter [Streptomyces sp. NPDC017979]|uniref:SulP family inorganic anion transporter n=1 Tax=Streptomyces sp. NPDC017979 TaxID=3365024 RepID=UPI0037A36958
MKSPSAPGSFGADFMASIVVFLVALPLCIGVAAASGVPVALGIITGIIGGLIVGFLPGSSLQVSGPAAGLAVLCLEFVTEHGLGLLGPVVLASGILQMILATLKMGRVFQSISLSVVQGMLAGIGVPLILGQIYALVDSKQHGTAPKNFMHLPDLAKDVIGDAAKSGALLIGAMAVVICFLWYKVPKPLNKVPAPLVAVMLGCVIAALPGFDVKKVAFGNMLDAVNIPGVSDISGLGDPKVLMMVVTFTVIASAESLFSAAAVDRMHTGPRTQYNKELFAQGVGNTVSGALGAMPLTAVIVRSAANVNAGARTKISRILHGVWLLGFGLLLPGLLGLIPITVLAGVLLHAGWKLFNPPSFVKMWKKDRGEGFVMFATTAVIVGTNLLEGVLFGLAVAVVLTALRMSHLTIRKTTDGDFARLEMKGNATFLRLPKLIDVLGSVEDKSRILVDARGILHLDMACKAQLEEWADQRRKAGAEEVELLLPSPAAEPKGEPTTTGAEETEKDSEHVLVGVGATTAGQHATAAGDAPRRDTAEFDQPPADHGHPPQPDTYRPYVPPAQSSSQQYGMGQGYAEGYVTHSTQPERQSQQEYGRTGHVPQQPPSQGHVPHQSHGPHQPPQQHDPHQHHQRYVPPQPNQRSAHDDARPPRGAHGPGPHDRRRPGDPPNHWGPEDDRAVQAYGEGNWR